MSDWPAPDDDSADNSLDSSLNSDPSDPDPRDASDVSYGSSVESLSHYLDRPSDISARAFQTIPDRLDLSAVPVSPLSRESSVPHSADLRHSFSQPELWRLGGSLPGSALPSPAHRQHPHMLPPYSTRDNHSWRSNERALQRMEEEQEQMLQEDLYDAEGAAAPLDPSSRQASDAKPEQTTNEAEENRSARADTRDTNAEQETDSYQGETDGDSSSPLRPPALPRPHSLRDVAGGPSFSRPVPTPSPGVDSSPGSKSSKRRSSVVSPSSDASSDEGDLPELSRWALIGLCLPAAAVMVGWAVGEALLLPYLLQLGVHPTVANFAFLINPLFGLFLQPLFGRWSDHCSLSWGRRRPFLLFFCMGSMAGLAIVVWCRELAFLLSGGKASEVGSHLQVVLVFVGFALMDLSHDLLLMPARALLNDRLPDEQTDDGNAYFACVSSLGSCVGLAFTIVPLENYWPWSILKLPVRATFATAIVIIFACNVITLIMSSGIDEPYVPEIEGEGEDEAEGEGEEETSSLLGKRNQASYGSAEGSKPQARSGDVSPPPDLERASSRFIVAREGSLRVAAEPVVEEEKKGWCWCFSENPLSGISDAYWILPRPLKFIWVLQLVWWYCALHVNLWWTSWVAVELYGGPSPEEAAAHKGHIEGGTDVDPNVAVRLATIGLLLQSVVSFPASAALPYFNRLLGITNVFHFCGIVYGLSVCAIGLVSTYTHTLIIMGVCGLALPPIFSSAYILVEVYASDADSDEDESESESEEEEEEEEEGEEGEQTSSPATRSLQAKPTDGTLQLAPQSASLVPRKSSSRRPSQIHPPEGLPAPALTPSPEPATGTSASTRTRRGSVQPVDTSPTDSDDADSSSDFTSTTLEAKRGTITALFNVTMIIAQTVVGLASGVLIDLSGNITIVFYVSGALMVISNVLVLFMRLSKPTEEQLEEEAEEIVAAAHLAKLQKRKSQHALDLEHATPSTRTPRPLASPALHDYIEAFESVPHVAPGVSADSQWVRPIGDERPYTRAIPRHPHHLAAAAPSLRRTLLKHSMSAPDLRLAARYLRKKRQAKAAAAMAAAKPPARVALFQPHGGPALGAPRGMTSAQRRELLRGGRPRLRQSRNARVEVESSDAGSQTAAQQTAAAEQRHQMRAAHEKRLEERRVEQLRERARLFGIQVATRAAQIKAARAKQRRPNDKYVVPVEVGGRAAPASAPARRNNDAPRQPPPGWTDSAPSYAQAAAAGTLGRSYAEAVASTTSYAAVAAGALSSGRAAPAHPPLPRHYDLDEQKGSIAESPRDDSGALPSTASVHWSVQYGQCDAHGVPLPTPGSEQERQLIERLAQASVAREHDALVEAQALIPPTSESSVTVHVPLVVPPEADARPVLLLSTSPNARAQGTVLLENAEQVVLPPVGPSETDTQPTSQQ